MIEVIILTGIYKGYKGIILNSNPLNKTYNVNLEANGVLLNIPHSSCQEISNISDEELYIFNNPSNIVHNNDSIYFISNTEPENYTIEDYDDPENKEIDNNIEEYKDNIETPIKRKRSSSSSKKYIQGYNENYSVNTQFNYNKDDKQHVPIIKQYLEEICAIVGIDILENENVFYYNHVDKILELINGTTEKIISDKQIDLLKQKKIKYDKTTFTTQGFKQYAEINEKNLKAITTGYMLFFINNVGLTNLHNFQAISFLKQYNEKITFTNYYYASLYTNNFFGKKTSFNNISTIINKITSFIESSNINYILFPDSEITTQNLNNIIVKKQEIIKTPNRPVKFLKLKVIPNDRTKRIKTLPINDSGLNKIANESYYENINLFKNFLKNIYYEYNSKIDIEQYIKNPNKFKISDKLANTLKFITKTLNLSNSQLVNSYFDINTENLDDIYDKNFIDSFNKFNILFKKEYNALYSKKLLNYSGIGFKKQNIKSNFEQFTYDKIKTIIMTRLESSNISLEILQFITKNIDNILNNDTNINSSKINSQIIKDIQHFYNVQYKILTKGISTDSSKQKESKDLYKYHYNDYMNYQHKKMQMLKLEETSNKFISSFQSKLKLNSKPKNENINNAISELIENEKPEPNTFSMETKLYEKGLLKSKPFSKFNSKIFSKKSTLYKTPFRISSDISRNNLNFKIDNATQKVINELSDIINKK